MPKKIDYSRIQADFYDRHPPLVPWPEMLVERGFNTTYKPREVFWKKYLDSLDIKEGSEVLDVGCGQGQVLTRLKTQYFINGKGVDISEKSVAFANKYYSKKNLNFLVIKATKLPFKNNSFDYVFSFDVLEHVEKQDKMIAEIIRVLRPGGKMLLYTLNANDRWTLNWIWEKLGFDTMSRALHKRELFVDPQKFTGKLKKMDMRIVSLRYYGAIFTLALDELFMVSLLIFNNINMLGKIILPFYNLISKASYPLLNWLDSFWYKRGYSLGFLIIAQKERVGK